MDSAADSSTHGSDMDWLIERFDGARERVAFIHRGTRFTYGQVVDRISELNQQLQYRDVGPQDTVAVVADYSPEAVCMLLALARIGATVVPITRTSVVEEKEVLGISGCTQRIEFTLDGTTWNLQTQQILVKNPLLDDLRRAGRPGLVLFSSGSTGKPKGMLHDLWRVMDKFRIQRAPVVAIPFLMLDHFGGINTVLAILSSLGTIVTTEDRSLASICKAVERYKIELLPTTPSFLTMLAATDLPNRYDLTSLTRITYGTETMPQATLDRIRSKFPEVELQQTYGLSEVGVLRSQSKPDGSLWMRIGGQGFETEVRDGILWVRSEFRMLGYLNATAAFDDDGWFNTEDRVEVDGEWFKILGRVTDVINVAGQKVYPAEVEDVILRLPNVTEVIVKGEKHTLLGQIVVAHISLTTPEPLPEVRRRVRAGCLAELSDYKVPAKVVLIKNEIHSPRFKKNRR